ncbi:hypothetical protein SDC9_98596 [bioreactor metagenome]|uniref:Uncharacterized protein n=1 Tax=bioreactor metagenome TaxID=1076179 RepID=A0A645AF62_9ZZZZ
MVTAVPGLTLLPVGERVMIGVVGAELETVKFTSVQPEYRPQASLARTLTVYVPAV